MRTTAVFGTCLVCFLFTRVSHGDPDAPGDGVRARALPLRDLSAAGVRGVPSAGERRKTRRRVGVGELTAAARQVESVLRSGGQLWLTETRARLVIQPGERARIAGDLSERSEEIRRVLLFGGSLRVDEHTTLVIRDERAVEAHVAAGSRTFVLIAPLGPTLRVVGLYAETEEPEARDAPAISPVRHAVVPVPRLVITEPASTGAVPAAPRVVARPRRQGAVGGGALWEALRVEYEGLAELEAELRSVRAAHSRLATAALPGSDLLALEARIADLELHLQSLWQRAAGAIVQLGRPLDDRQRRLAPAKGSARGTVTASSEGRAEFEKLSRGTKRKEATRSDLSTASRGVLR